MKPKPKLTYYNAIYIYVYMYSLYIHIQLERRKARMFPKQLHRVPRGSNSIAAVNSHCDAAS